MALLDQNEININNIEQWFSNIVDIVNANYDVLIDNDPGLDKLLTYLDTAPIQDIKNAFKALYLAIDALDKRVTRIEG